MVDKKLGVVISYYGNISVAAIELTDGGLKIGDKIKIKGSTTDFQQTITSMQIEHEVVNEAEKGDSVGIKVKDKVRTGDVVYKVAK